MKFRTTLFASALCLSVASAYAEDQGATNGLLRGYYNKEGKSPKANGELKDPAGADRTGKIEVDRDRRLEVKTDRDRLDVKTDAHRGDLNHGGPMERITKASDLMGMKIKNSKGETLGSISDVALDLQSGKINYAVLSSGGILGFRDRLYAVPVSALQRGTEDKVLIFDVDKEALQSTPGFVKNVWPERADESLGMRINRNANSELRDPAGAKIRVDGDHDAKIKIDTDRDSRLKVEKDGDTKLKVERKD